MGCNSMCNKRIVVDDISNDHSAKYYALWLQAGGWGGQVGEMRADRKIQGGIAICVAQ